MLALLTVTFSALKGTALAVAIVNAVVLAGALVCLFLAWKLKAEPEEKPRSFFDEPENSDDSSENSNAK